MKPRAYPPRKTGPKQLTRVPNGFIRSKRPANPGVPLTTSICVRCGRAAIGTIVEMELGVQRMEDTPTISYTAKESANRIAHLDPIQFFFESMKRIIANLIAATHVGG
jgi:hypothetical protein